MWITSNLEEAILYSNHTLKAQKNYDNQFKWQEGTFHSKVMCGWLPTNKTRGHITGISGCPGCRCRIETLNYVLKCPNIEGAKTR
jgi:hypothetical protein